MNVKDFTYLLQNPNETISSEQTKQLEGVLEAFPFFQAARAVRLKGLKNLNSYKYNNALKIAAAYTTDRDILFDFITSQEFLQNSIADSISGKATSLVDTDIVFEVEKDSAIIENSSDEPLPQASIAADHILDPNLFKSKDPNIDAEIKKTKEQAKEELELGQPLTFTKKEKYSFGEWLQLTSKKAIERKTNSIESEPTKNALEKSILKEKKFDLVDKFIAQSPKIVPNENQSPKVDTKKVAKFNAKELMTETLAKVYLEQKNYKKAVKAYHILSLKYPEKSSFFANRIKAIEKIKKENI